MKRETGDQYRFELERGSEEAALFRLLKRDRSVKSIVVMGIRALYTQAEKNDALLELFGVKTGGRIKEGIDLVDIAEEVENKKGGRKRKRENDTPAYEPKLVDVEGDIVP